MADTFAKIPHDVLRRTDLTAATKLVYAAIVDRIGDNRSSWPGVRRIAADCGLGVATVCGAVKALKAAGLLIVVNGAGGKTNNYTIARSDSERSETEHPSALGNQNKGARISEQGRSDSGISALGNQNITRLIEPDPHNQTKRTRPTDTPWDLALRFITDDTFKSEEFKAAWDRWAKHRREIRKALTQSSVGQQIAHLQKAGLKRAVETIDLSIRSGWQGLFPDKTAPRNEHAGNGKPWAVEKIHETITPRILNA